MEFCCVVPVEALRWVGWQEFRDERKLTCT